MTVSQRDRRALTIGVVVIGLCVAIARGRPAWVDWRQRTVDAATDAISEERQMDAAMTALPGELDTLEARTALLSKAGALVLSGETASDAAGSLSALVAEAAHRSKIRMNGVSVRADTSGRGFAHIRIDLDGTGDVNGLSVFLAQLDRGPTLVSVPHLVIRTTNAESDTLGAEQLSLQMTIEGLASIRPPRDGQ